MIKNCIFLLIFLSFNSCVIAQQTIFDIASFSPPAGWEKSESPGVVSYSVVDSADGTICLLTIYNSTNGSGDPDVDFATQWNEKAAIPFKVKQYPDVQKGTTTEGWDLRIGLDTFSRGGATYIAMLTVITGFNKSFDIMVITNNKKYFAPLDVFYKSIVLQKPVAIAPLK